MGDTRFRDGLAFGPYSNFFATSANVFTQADTTPDVTNGNLFYSNNTTNTTITHFDLTSVNTGGTWSQQFQGKVIRVLFLDDSTRLVNGGRLVLASSDGLQGASNSIELMYHNSSWYEWSRSYNRSNVFQATSANLGAAGTVTITGAGPSVVVRVDAAASSAGGLRRVIGGEQGQLVHVVASAGSAALIIVNSDAADTFISTSTTSATQFRLASSAIVSFVRIADKWREIRPVWSNSTEGIST